MVILSGDNFCTWGDSIDVIGNKTQKYIFVKLV